MADAVQRVEYYYVTAPGTPGQGNRILSALKDEGATQRKRSQPSLHPRWARPSLSAVPHLRTAGHVSPRELA